MSSIVNSVKAGTEGKVVLAGNSTEGDNRSFDSSFLSWLPSAGDLDKLVGDT